MLKTEKALTIVFGALVLAGVLACGSSSSPTPPAPGVPVPGAPVAVPGTPVPGMPMPGMPGAPQVVQPGAGGGESNFGTVSLRTGFMPDPKVAQGRSGGARDAQTLNSECRGWIDANKPDHIFVAETAFGMNFRILAHSTSQPTKDITLVIQKPDGTFVCNDDAAPPATDPIIANQNFMPGIYKVWVGSYQQGEFADYRIGFTEMSNVTTEQLQGATPN